MLTTLLTSELRSTMTLPEPSLILVVRTPISMTVPVDDAHLDDVAHAELAFER